MLPIKIVVTMLDVLGSVILKKESKSDFRDHSNPYDRNGPPKSVLKVRVVPTSVLVFVLFTPVCVATGGTFEQCMGIFQQLNIEGGH